MNGKVFVADFLRSDPLFQSFGLSCCSVLVRSTDVECVVVTETTVPGGEERREGGRGRKEGRRKEGGGGEEREGREGGRGREDEGGRMREGIYISTLSSFYY